MAIQMAPAQSLKSMDENHDNQLLSGCIELVGFVRGRNIIDVPIHGIETAPECGQNATWRVVRVSVVSAVSGVTPGLTAARLGTIAVGI
jgi:hypothetical protein